MRHFALPDKGSNADRGYVLQEEPARRPAGLRAGSFVRAFDLNRPTARLSLWWETAPAHGAERAAW